MWTFWSHENAKDSAVWWPGCLLTQLSEPEFKSVWTHLSTNVPGACALKVKAYFSRPSPLWAIKIMSKSHQGQEKNVLKSHIYISCLYLKKKKRKNVISKFFYNKHNGFGQVLGQGGWKLFAWPLRSQQAADSPRGNRCSGLKSGGETGHHRRKGNKELPVNGKCQACGFCREAGFVSEKAGVSLGDRGAS